MCGAEVVFIYIPFAESFGEILNYGNESILFNG